MKVVYFQWRGGEYVLYMNVLELDNVTSKPGV